MKQEELDEMDDEELLDNITENLREAEVMVEELGERTIDNSEQFEWGVLANIDSALRQINNDIEEEDISLLIK